MSLTNKDRRVLSILGIVIAGGIGAAAALGFMWGLGSTIQMSQMRTCVQDLGGSWNDGQCEVQQP